VGGGGGAARTGAQFFGGRVGGGVNIRPVPFASFLVAKLIVVRNLFPLWRS